MKKLLVATAVVELGAGVALLSCPSVMVKMLLGSGLDTPAAVALGRVAGAALLALGVACCLACLDAQSLATRGLVVAMLLYNLAASSILAYAGFGLEMAGVALWPAVVLHAGMGAWCIACLRMKRKV